MQPIDITGKLVLEAKAEFQLTIIRHKIRELDREIDKFIKILEEVDDYETQDLDYYNYRDSIEFLG